MWNIKPDKKISDFNKLSVVHILKTLLSLGLTQVDIARCIGVAKWTISYTINRVYAGEIVLDKMLDLMARKKIRTLHGLYSYIKNWICTEHVLRKMRGLRSTLKRLEPERADLLIYEEVMTDFILWDKNNQDDDIWS